jgi:hypothetical protein
VAAPKATAGQLCIYEGELLNMELFSWENPLTGETGGAITRFGFEMVGFAELGGGYIATGSWAVTAP